MPYCRLLSTRDNDTRGFLEHFLEHIQPRDVALLLNLHLFLTWLLHKSITFIVKNLSALQQVLNLEFCQQSPELSGPWHSWWHA